MRISLYYGSTEGQTARIAAFIEARLRGMGHQVDAFDASRLDAGHRMAPSDIVIVAASLHLERYQASVEHLVRNNPDALRSVFISVSLSAAGDEADRANVERCAAGFLERVGWRPDRVEHVAGAFRFTQYDFFKRLALKYIAYRKGQPTDTNRDYELTDWPRLEAFIDQLAAGESREGPGSMGGGSS